MNKFSKNRNKVLKLVATYLLFFASKTIHAQDPTIVKFPDFNYFIRIYSNCQCGDEIINDSTKVTFRKRPGTTKDTIALKVYSTKEIHYVIEPGEFETTISGVEVDIKGNSKIKQHKLRYYLVSKID